MRTIRFFRLLRKCRIVINYTEWLLINDKQNAFTTNSDMYKYQVLAVTEFHNSVKEAYDKLLKNLI
jgi:hypothetical protein